MSSITYSLIAHCVDGLDSSVNKSFVNRSTLADLFDTHYFTSNRDTVIARNYLVRLLQL